MCRRPPREMKNGKSHAVTWKRSTDVQTGSRFGTACALCQPSAHRASACSASRAARTADPAPPATCRRSGAEGGLNLLQLEKAVERAHDLDHEALEQTPPSAGR